MTFILVQTQDLSLHFCLGFDQNRINFCSSQEWGTIRTWDILREEKIYSSYCQSQLCSSFIDSNTNELTYNNSAQTSLPGIVYTGPHLDLRATAHYWNPYTLPPAQLILSGTGYLCPWRSTCSGTWPDQPWENTFSSWLTGATSRDWGFQSSSQSPWQCPNSRTGISVVWLHYHLLLNNRLQYPSIRAARSPVAEILLHILQFTKG